MQALRAMIRFINPVKEENRHPVSHLDGADKCLVDSSAFCCPVCYEVYSKVPLILPCGHTFCRPCVRRMAGEVGEVQCPLCRLYTFKNECVPNYVVEDILKTMEQIVGDVSVEVLNANLRAVKGRLERHVSELEAEKAALEKRMSEQEERIVQLQSVAIACVPAFIYVTFKLIQLLVDGSDD